MQKFQNELVLIIFCKWINNHLSTQWWKKISALCILIFDFLFSPLLTVLTQLGSSLSWFTDIRMLNDTVFLSLCCKNEWNKLELCDMRMEFYISFCVCVLLISGYKFLFAWKASKLQLTCTVIKSSNAYKTSELNGSCFENLIYTVGFVFFWFLITSI